MSDKIIWEPEKNDSNKTLVISFKLDMEQFDSNYSYFAGQLKQVISQMTRGKSYNFGWEIRK